jgi:tetratricopeptide (TPR) repeat protein
MRLPIFTLIAVLLAPAIFAANSGPMSGSGGGVAAGPRMQKPQDAARFAFNDGLSALKKADKLSGKGKDASKQYARARDEFTEALRNVSTMHEAWNGLGYSLRKLGDYENALLAYDKALSIRPSYPEAMEYRGEAYLALNRVDDAKQAYLDLYAGNRKLADQLLVAMQKWVEVNRGAGADASMVDSLDQWVQERARIAGQTASLTRTGANESWR